MTTNDLDELPVPHFEDGLWSELTLLHQHSQHQLHSQPDHRSAQPSTTGADPSASLAPTPPARRRRPGRRSIAVGLVGLAAAATLVTAVVVSRSSDGSQGGGDVAGGGPRASDQPTDPGGGTSSDGEPVTLEARIVAATDEAMASSVVHVVQDHSVSSDSERWSDEQSGAFRVLLLDASGDPAFDVGPAVPPTPGQQAIESPEAEAPDDSDVPRVIERQVDHCFQEYTESRVPGPESGGHSEARSMRDRLESGELVVDGTELRDGRELNRLVSAEDQGEGFTYLVDPDTHRPLEASAYHGTDAEYVMRFEYLPRTPENLAQLSPPVPEGFTQVDDLEGDAERTGAGCS